MRLARKLNQTVSVYRGSTSRAATGTVTRAIPGAATSTCKGRLLPGHGGTVETDQGRFYEADAALVVPAGTDIRPQTDDADAGGQGDWVKINSITYRVVSGVNPASAGKLLHFLLKRVT